MRKNICPSSSRFPPNKPIIARSVLARSARAPCGQLDWTRDRRSRRRRGSGPHVLGIQRFNLRKVFVTIEKRPIHLVEVQCAFGHSPHDPAAGRAQDPFRAGLFRARPNWHAAGCAVRQRPIRPPLVCMAEPLAHLDGVCAKSIQHIVVDDRQLLHRIVNIHAARLEAQRGSQFRISDRRDTRRAVTRQVHHHPVRLLVIQGCEYSFP